MIYTAFTMDCEQLQENSHAGGPANWALSERAIRGFAERLLERGYRATFFIIPQTARQQARLFEELETEGFEMGLHLHTLDQGWEEHLGGMTPDIQRQAVARARDIWADALGRLPKAFRGGNLSANDHTFPILAEMGFTHASASVPRRRLLTCRAVWEGAPPYPHWAHAGNRLLEGNLSLLEVPVACHPTLWNEPARVVPWELRIEGVEWEYHNRIIDAHLDWQQSLKAPLTACVPFTHNTREYSDPADEMTRRLVRVMDLIEEQAERRSNGVAKTTTGGIYEACLTAREEKS
ncbi:MAG: polysaccharide deacetylase family protein [Armatimonadetes bacterium]|nr:polysaccharide deacetylase family protein [Armatimonadota bacterium]